MNKINLWNFLSQFYNTISKNENLYKDLNMTGDAYYVT